MPGRVVEKFEVGNIVNQYQVSRKCMYDIASIINYRLLCHPVCISLTRTTLTPEQLTVELFTEFTDASMPSQTILA